MSSGKRKSDGISDDSNNLGDPLASMTKGETVLEKFNRELTEIQAAFNMKGYCTVRYAERKDSEEEEEDSEDSEEEEEEEDYTAEDLSFMRFFLINDARDKAMAIAENFVMAGQANEGFAFFNTTTGNNIILQMKSMINKAMKKKKMSDRLNAMFALTFWLRQQDEWINDNECYGEGDELAAGVEALANAWKKLLKESNETLGIESDTSHQGVIALLEGFGEFIEKNNREGWYTFNWKD